VKEEKVTFMGFQSKQCPRQGRERKYSLGKGDVGGRR
jgi:hypothetical protein